MNWSKPAKKWKTSEKSLETQNETLKIQKFEAALYNMLGLQQQIVNDLAYDTKVEGYSDTTARGKWPVVVKGRDLFKFSFEQLIHNYTGADGVKRTTEGMKGILEIKGL